MKYILSVIIIIHSLLALPQTLKAQVERGYSPTVSRVTSVASDDATQCPSAGTNMLPLSSAFWFFAPGFEGLSPWRGSGYGSERQLHDGFNAQLGFDFTVGLGKNCPKGIGWGQNLAFAYTLSLAPRLSAAVGVYASNMNWGDRRTTDGAVAAVLKYRLNDAINFYAYGTKSFLPKAKRYYQWPVPYGQPIIPKERYGVITEIKLGTKAMIQVEVERQDY